MFYIPGLLQGTLEAYSSKLKFPALSELRKHEKEKKGVKVMGFRSGSHSRSMAVLELQSKSAAF